MTVPASSGGVGSHRASRTGPENGQIRLISRSDSCYPPSLSELRDQPRQLHAIGDVGLLATPHTRVVAIVGTREASPYGIRVAHALGRAFAEAGAVVVSGMARGIDSAAHHGALSAAITAPDTGNRALSASASMVQGIENVAEARFRAESGVRARTIAVLGTGPDVPYPAGNRGLHRLLAERGLILAESGPGTRAFPGCFPRRNRIIAAIARLTIVVEAGHKSGALNTASQALDMGRLVAAVPGPIDHPRSAGSNTLLRDGAHVVTTIDDALGLLGLSRSDHLRRPDMGTSEAEVWDVLQGGGAPPDAISAASGIPVRQVLAAVAKLELLGLVTVENSGAVRPNGLARDTMRAGGTEPPKFVRERVQPYRPSVRSSQHKVFSR